MRRTIYVAALAAFTICIPAFGAASATGTAVYYSDHMNGKPVVAKGEKYDSNGMTAATHGRFPIGSSVKVTNLSNQKSVVVKVNDRMNPNSKAVIDVSKKAAEELDMIHNGHAKVKVEVVTQ